MRKIMLFLSFVFLFVLTSCSSINASKNNVKYDLVEANNIRFSNWYDINTETIINFNSRIKVATLKEYDYDNYLNHINYFEISGSKIPLDFDVEMAQRDIETYKIKNYYYVSNNIFYFEYDSNFELYCLKVLVTKINSNGDFFAIPLPIDLAVSNLEEINNRLFLSCSFDECKTFYNQFESNITINDESKTIDILTNKFLSGDEEKVMIVKVTIDFNNNAVVLNY